MERALVVFDEEDTELLTEAGELAAGVGAELAILALMTTEEFEDNREMLDVVAQEENTSYDDSVVLDVVRNEAKEAAEEAYDDLELDWSTIVSVVNDDETDADRILDAADDSDADHVFITGTKRSPTGKAVFGDRTQSVILNFDGPVTTLLQ